jgi:hypothetical protein
MDALTGLNTLYREWTAKVEDPRIDAAARLTYHECAIKLLAEIKALEHLALGHRR